MEQGTPLAVAGAVGGCVHRQHQRFVASGFSALHQFAGKAPVVLQVELKPQRAVRRVCEKTVCYVLQRRAGLGAEHQSGAQRGGSKGAGVFAIRVCQVLESHGGQQNGVFQSASQQRDAGVPARQGAQDARL